MSEIIKPGSTIGILGGGQLGRMMAISAKEMGYRIAVLEPKKDSPCGQVADVEVISEYNDLEGARQLAKQCDVLTYEFENIDHKTAEWLEKNLYLPQGYKLLQITQHRALEKEAIQSLEIPVAPFRIIHHFEDLSEAINEIGVPSVLKTCRGGSDGKGQVVIHAMDEVNSAFEELKDKGELVLEKWISFEKELSVIVTRNVSGEVTTFPVAENIHQNNILHQSIVPARVSKDIQDKAKELAMKLANGLEMIGTLAVEMFLTKSGEIYVNELAPRPHNSGHYTIDACETSQFEQHIRAICDLPLGKTNLLKPVVMVNILGEHVPDIMDKLPEFDSIKLHLYGKEEAKTGRKMGHINVLADSVDEALTKINSLAIWTN